MTLKQYQKLAKAIADKIIELGGDPRSARHLKLVDKTAVVAVRDPKKYADHPVTMNAGDYNRYVSFDEISNPNNPNWKFKTLKPGSISAYESATCENVDLTEYRFDTRQFHELLNAISMAVIVK